MAIVIAIALRRRNPMIGIKESACGRVEVTIIRLPVCPKELLDPLGRCLVVLVRPR